MIEMFNIYVNGNGFCIPIEKIDAPDCDVAFNYLEVESEGAYLLFYDNVESDENAIWPESDIVDSVDSKRFALEMVLKYGLKDMR